MKDFDFEEIDKAVAGALASDVPVAQGSPSSEEVQPTPVETKIEQAPEPETTPEVEETPRIAPAARRSSGRFMDVVHPSSDMRSRSTFTPPSRSPATDSATSVAEPSPETKSTNEPETSSLEDELEAWAKPLESPFLPDAKVEKRPLGGIPSASDIPLEDLLLDEPDEPRLEAPDEPRLEAPDELRLEATTMPDPIDFAAHSNALSSEKEDTGEGEQPESEPVVGEITPVEEIIEEETPVFEPSPEPTSVAEEEITGPTSITQQYTEQPSTAQEPGAMYDTEAYHQAIVPTVKKKSGIWVILWILLLVVLGAGAGVLFYLFVLPQL